MSVQLLTVGGRIPKNDQSRSRVYFRKSNRFKARANGPVGPTGSGGASGSPFESTASAAVVCFEGLT